MGKYHLIAELARGAWATCTSQPSAAGRLQQITRVEGAESPSCRTTKRSSRCSSRRRAWLRASFTRTSSRPTKSPRRTGAITSPWSTSTDDRSRASCVVLPARKAFPIGAQLRIIGDALLGLHHAHELRGFDGGTARHRPPGRQPAQTDGHVRWPSQGARFRIAKAVDRRSRRRPACSRGASRTWRPEQACSVKVDRRADIYSMGVMIWEAAAERRLWPGMSEVEILSRVLRDGAPRLRDVVPDAPQALDAICSRAMARDCRGSLCDRAGVARRLEAHIAHRNDKMTMRQIGELIAVGFAEERHKMNQIIEETLARVSSGRARV